MKLADRYANHWGLWDRYGSYPNRKTYRRDDELVDNTLHNTTTSNYLLMYILTMATLEERLEQLGLEVVIGLETHVELNTKSKMFCACKNEDTDQPNIYICPLCTGQLGILPRPNQEAIKKTVEL